LLQQAFTRRLHAFNDDLVIAARLIEGYAGAHQHLLTMLRAKGHAAVTVAEHGAAHLGGVIFEGEIPVP